MNTRRGRPPIPKPPVAYKYRKIFETNGNPDEIIDLTPAIAAPVSTEVVDAAQTCSSGQSKSASVDNRNEIVIEHVTVTVIASDDPIGDNLDQIPARKRAKRDNSAPWMAHIQLFEIVGTDGKVLKRARYNVCPNRFFFFVDANVYCHLRVGVGAGGPRRLEQSERGEPPPRKQPKRILGSSVSLTMKT